MAIIQDQFHQITFCITDHHPGIGFGYIIIPGTILMFVYQHVIHHAGFFIDLIDFNTISFQIVRKDPFFKGHLRFLFPDIVKQAIKFKVRYRKDIVRKDKSEYREAYNQDNQRFHNPVERNTC